MTAATVWTVPATVLRVVDADTLDVSLDLGWHITLHAKVRLAGVNAPELATAAGKAARDWVVSQLLRLPNGDIAEYRPVTVVSHSLDKYGRVLGDVFVGPAVTGTSLSGLLLAAGHAVPMGG